MQARSTPFISCMRVSPHIHTIQPKHADVLTLAHSTSSFHSPSPLPSLHPTPLAPPHEACPQRKPPRRRTQCRFPLTRRLLRCAFPFSVSFVSLSFPFSLRLPWFLCSPFGLSFARPVRRAANYPTCVQSPESRASALVSRACVPNVATTLILILATCFICVRAALCSLLPSDGRCA